MFDLALLNGKVFLANRVTDANIYAKGGKIARISRSSNGRGSVGADGAETVVDCTGLLVLPGVIDAHVHFREPGWTHKEDWATGSAAAAAGGVTTVIEMPNTNPATTTVELLEEKRKIAKAKSVIDFRLNFGATNANMGEFKKAKDVAGLKIFMGSSTGSLLLEKDEDILAAFKAAKAKKVPAVVHAEDEALVRKFTEDVKASGRTDALAHCDARPVSAAVRAVERAVALAATVRNQLHVAHVSTEAELAVISDAKESSVSVTCEATPHQLFLSVHDVSRLGNFAKMNPPLRSERDRLALLRALEWGLVDTVGSDHAPHTREEKHESVWKAPSGVPGVQTLLPLLLNEHEKGNLSLQRLVEATSVNPARIFKLKNKGAIKAGMDADFSIVDLKKEWKITDEAMLSKCGWTPFHGRTVKGRVELTVSRGKLVFDGEKVIRD